MEKETEERVPSENMSRLYNRTRLAMQLRAEVRVETFHPRVIDFSTARSIGDTRRETIR